MLFPIGTKVKFLHASDEGIVTGHLDDGMLNVLVIGWDMEIPVFAEDLIPADPVDLPPPPKPASAKQVTPAPAPPPARKAPAEPEPVAAHFPGHDSGILLAFDPVLLPDATAEKYRIFLLNDTQYDVIFTLDLFIRDEHPLTRNGKLKSAQYIQLGDLLFDDLNDSPQFDLECWRITTDGTGTRHRRELKIKAKQFFGRVSHAPLLNRSVHLFSVFDNLREERISTPQEDLKTYTIKNARPLVSESPAVEPEAPHEVREFAEFVPELDLHIEKLTHEPQKLSNAQILQLQIRVMEDYLDRAIRLGVERVFIIHGVGKGRLRDAIATRLIRMPEVMTFKNEYHPRYGYGATEVIFL